MSRRGDSWQDEIHRILPGGGDGRARIDYPAIRNLVNTYLVRSLDGTALRFSIPVLLTAPVSGPGPGGGFFGNAFGHRYMVSIFPPQ